MDDQVRITSDHAEIKAWAEANQGKPQLIDDIEADGDRKAIRFDFPGQRDEAFVAETKLVDTDWTEFFKIFDRRKLAMIYIDSHHLEDPRLIYGAYQFINREEYEKIKQDASEIAEIKSDFLHNYRLGR